MYNEERGAEACVRSVCAALRQFRHRTALVAVNDGSRDRTGEILSGLTASEPLLVEIHHKVNAGYGAALRTGTEYAAAKDFEYAIFMDSDLTNDPADLPRFVQEMERGIDLIKASRYVKGGKMDGVPFRRRIISQAGNGMACFLFGMGIRDCTNGFRAVKVGLLKQMNLVERGFPIIMEELYNCKFLAKSCREIPVVLSNRSTDQRPTSFSYKPATFRKYLGFGLKAFLGVKPQFRKGDLN
jgi:glycosyltransferase involved in cell wall biosynthesis